jgi:hypothetical protein
MQSASTTEINIMQQVTDSQLLAMAPDGSPLRSWTEGDKTFREIYVYVKAQSGITYGVVNVIEITPCKA